MIELYLYRNIRFCEDYSFSQKNPPSLQFPCIWCTSFTFDFNQHSAMSEMKSSFWHRNIINIFFKFQMHQLHRVGSSSPPGFLKVEIIVTTMKEVTKMSACWQKRKTRLSACRSCGHILQSLSKIIYILLLTLKRRKKGQSLVFLSSSSYPCYDDVVYVTTWSAIFILSHEKIIALSVIIPCEVT